MAEKSANMIVRCMKSPLTWPANDSGSQRPSMTVSIILIESDIVLKEEETFL